MQNNTSAIPKVGATDIDYFEKVAGKKATDAMPALACDGGNWVRNLKDANGMPIVWCMPNCTKDHRHMFEQDFSKNCYDPIDDRPGYFKSFNEELDQNKKSNS